MQESSNKRATIIFLGSILLICLALAGFIAKPFFEALAMAVILAVAFHPLHKRLLSLVRTPNRAALLTVLIIIVAIAIPVTAVLIAASTQALQAAHVITQKSAEQGGFLPFLMKLCETPLRLAGRYFDVSQIDVREQLVNALNRVSGFLLRSGASVLGNIVGFIGNALLALFATFFFLRDGERSLNRIIAKLPVTTVQANLLLHGVRETIIANLYAIVAVGGAQGLLTGIALAIVGFRAAILLGLIASICSLIPLVGPSLVWGPAAAYLFFTGRIWAAIFVAAWGILVVGTSDNVIRPLVVGGRIETHPLLLLLSLLGGAQAFGLIGIFLGPVLVSLITALIKTLGEMTGQEDPAESAHAGGA